MSDCDHNWRLTETGYIRTWHTQFDEKSRTLIAFYSGSEDFSEEGAGDEHLQCSTCLEVWPIPEGWGIDYR